MMQRIIFFIFATTLVVFGGGFVAMGATENIPVTQVIGFDTTPPTIPAGLTATPIASSQINLSWTASIDDYSLAGYQVFRDDIQIATTTATNYSDTGLTASTTYTYYVTAFDTSNNFSASSSPASTTTPDIAIPPVATSTATSTNTQGSIVKLKLTRLEVIPEQNAVTIRYETNLYARTSIRWGRTVSYELGSLTEPSFRTVHETKIVGLTPGTVYKFIIEGESSSGRQSVLTESTFVTLPQNDIFPPANVLNLRAQKDGGDIVLTWTNPKDIDFSHVRILRNDLFYPSDTADGWVVYEGDDEMLRDRGMAIPGTRQFYTVFTYDTLGNISSGAVVSIRIGDGSTTTGPVIVVDEFTNPLSLKLDDFSFIQDNIVLTIVGERSVIIDGSKQLIISLPYERVPEHLKTILVILEDPTDATKEFSFLLRINSEKTAYTALLAPLEVSGVFPVRVTIFDFKTTQIGYTYGEIISRISYIEGSEGENISSNEGWASVILRILTSYFFWFIVILTVLTLSGWRLVRRHE